MEKRVEDLFFCFVINISNESVLKYLPYLDVVRAQTFNPKKSKISHGSRRAHRRRGTTSTTGHWTYY